METQRLIRINRTQFRNWRDTGRFVSLQPILEKCVPRELDLTELELRYARDEFPEDMTGVEFYLHLEKSGLLPRCLGLHEGDEIDYWEWRVIPEFWWSLESIYLWKSAALSQTDNGIWVPYLKLGPDYDMGGRKTEIHWDQLDDGTGKFGAEGRIIYPNVFLMKEDLLFDGLIAQ